MKKVLSLVLICSVLLTSCADSLSYKDKDNNKQTAESVGLFNQSDKDPNADYKLCVGNIVWSIILCETIIAPIYFIGWSIMEPVTVKQNIVLAAPIADPAQEALKDEAREKQGAVLANIEAHLDVAEETLLGEDGH